MLPAGQPVLAARDGEVIAAGTEGTLGNVVLIDHGGGLKTGYGHMSQLKVAKGDCVSAWAKKSQRRAVRANAATRICISQFCSATNTSIQAPCSISTNADTAIGYAIAS